MNISNIVYGDAIINHVAGILNPVRLGMHLLNVNTQLADKRLKQILQDDTSVPLPYLALSDIHADDRLGMAVVSRYLEASAAVEKLLQDPTELKDLERKYGANNLSYVKEYAEKYLDASVNLLLVMKDVTAEDNASREWIVKTFDQLKSFSYPLERPRKDKKPSPLSLIAVEGKRVDSPATT